MKKVLTAIAAFAPIVISILCGIILGVGIVAESEGLAIFGTVLFFIAVFLAIPIMILFIVLAIMNKNLSTTAKIIWCIVLWICNILAFPVFWFVCILKE